VAGNKYGIIFVLLLATLLACSIDVQLTPTAQPPQAPPEAPIVATENRPTDIPPAEQPTELATDVAAASGTVAGFSVMDPSAGRTLRFYDRACSYQKEFVLPNNTSIDSGILQTLGSLDTPLTFYTTSTDYSTFDLFYWDARTSQSNPVTKINGFITGSAGSGLMLVYGLVLPTSAEQLPSELWGGNVLGAPELLYRIDSSQYDVILPLAVVNDGGALKGVWFTRRPWGIGGDIVFEPMDGLYYLEKGSSAPTQVLEAGKHPCGLSNDHTLVAWTDASTGLMVTNLTTGQTMAIALDPSSDRGAGNCAFSPSNDRIAWMEGSGFQMAETPNFTARIRTAVLVNNAIQEVMNTPVATYNLTDMLGVPVVALRPQAWLDDTHLLLDTGWGEYHKLFVLDVSANRISQQISGSLVSVFYNP
jgi:hypothetical protein